jgi:hypothetical protein
MYVSTVDPGPGGLQVRITVDPLTVNERLAGASGLKEPRPLGSGRIEQPAPVVKHSQSKTGLRELWEIVAQECDPGVPTPSLFNDAAGDGLVGACDCVHAAAKATVAMSTAKRERCFMRTSFRVDGFSSGRLDPSNERYRCV